MDYVDIILLFVSVLNIFCGVFVFTKNRTSVSVQLFALLFFFISAWSSSMFVLREVTDDALALIFVKFLYTSAAFIPLVSVLFAMQFPSARSRLSEYNITLLFIPLPFVIWLVWHPGALVYDVSVPSNGVPRQLLVNFNIVPHMLYVAYVTIYFVLTHWFLWKIGRDSNKRLHKQVTYIMFGTISTILVNFVTNIWLPFLGNFNLNWVGPTATTIMIISISYAIYHHKAFNVRVQLSEFLAILLIGVSIADILIGVYYIDSLLLFLWKLFTLFVVIYVTKLLLDKFFYEQKQKKELRRMNEYLKQMDRRKNEFLHIATHQMRGPVTAIAGYTSLLKEGLYGKAAKYMEEPLNRIEIATQSLNRAIDSYMNVARIEEGRLQLSPSEVVLCDLLNESVSSYKMLANQSGVDLILDIPADTDQSKCKTYIDKKTICEAIGSLIENAIKYTPSGGSVTVTGKLSDDKSNAIIHIKDTGIGIPKDELDDIFTKFSRASNAKSMHVSGTGMGLFVAKKLVEVNNGVLSVHSDGVGKGTTFTITLPLMQKPAHLSGNISHKTRRKTDKKLWFFDL